MGQDLNHLPLIELNDLGGQQALNAAIMDNLAELVKILNISNLRSG